MWIFSSIIFIIGLCQATILDAFKIFGVKPDLLLISVVISSLYLDLKRALALSIFAGLLKDSLILNSFGINTLLFPLWSFLIIRISKKIPLDNDFICSALIFIIVISNDIVISLIFLIGHKFIPAGVFLRTMILEAVYTASFFLLVSKALKGVNFTFQATPVCRQAGSFCN